MRTICKSGAQGWQSRLQENYGSWDNFKSYCRLYNIHRRLGFRSMKAAWGTNPVIQGSVIPEDFCVVK